MLSEELSSRTLSSVRFREIGETEVESYFRGKINTLVFVYAEFECAYFGYVEFEIFKWRYRIES